MTEPTRDYEALFREQQPFIERAAAPQVARRMGFEGPVADEFVAWATSQLWADDHALLRRWRGNCSPRGFVMIMLTRLAREFRRRR